MDELEPLASALRRELGAPPEAWQKAQRLRFRESLGAPARPSKARFALWILAPAALIVATLLLVIPRGASEGAERWLTGEELSEPIELADGSRISLETGARGRLSESASAVRFDLHRGRVSFEVKPGGERTWLVSAGRNEVRVVGTRFSVFYGAEETFEVEVERGIVSVRVPERNASLELEAGDRLHGRAGRLEVARTAPPAPVPTPAPEPGAAPPPPATEPPAHAAPAEAPARDDWQARYRTGKYGESLALARANGLPARLDQLPAGELAKLAEVARLGGDPELAARALRALLRRFPGSAEARDGSFLLGRVHVLRGDSAAALAAFERYLESGQTLYRAEALGRIMELYAARGERVRARSAASRYLELSPSGPYRRLAESLTAEK